MKPQPIFKWLVLVGSSAALALSTAHADPEPDKKDDNKGKSERVDKKGANKPNADRPKNDKPDRKASDKPGPSSGEKAERRQERAEDKRERVEDRKERTEDRREKADDRQERAEDKRERVEDRQERAEDRREDRERRIYKRGEFRERFVDRDRDRIVTYFSGHKSHSHGLPPGLASKWDNGRRLPAGWRDRVVTGYVIEDEWRPYFEPVPYSWFPGITVVADTRLYWYGDRVVRVYEPTHEVVDVVVVPTIHIDL